MGNVEREPAHRVGTKLRSTTRGWDRLETEKERLPAVVVELKKAEDHPQRAKLISRSVLLGVGAAPRIPGDVRQGRS